MKRILRFILKYFLLLLAVVLALAVGYGLSLYSYWDLVSAEKANDLIKYYQAGYVTSYYSLWTFYLRYILFLRGKFSYGFIGQVLEMGLMLAIFGLLIMP